MYVRRGNMRREDLLTDCLISGGIALIAYAVVPDILNRAETVCFIMSIAAAVLAAIECLKLEWFRLQTGRDKLEIRRNRKRQKKAVDIRVSRRSRAFTIPAEKVAE